MQGHIACQPKSVFFWPDPSQFPDVTAVTAAFPEGGGVIIFIFFSRGNPVKFTDPDGREDVDEISAVTKQLTFLKNYVANANNMPTLQDRANAAKYLRDYIRNFDINGLITGPDGNEKFMNETLRDFLNTSDTGRAFMITDMKESSGWTEMVAGASEHQQSRHPRYANRKFTNVDGREAVFTTRDGKSWTLSNHPRDKGTFNYARNNSQWTANSEHGRWDMNPYFRQFGITKWYRSLEGYHYSTSDYNRNNR
jgi:hypothetical protein